MFNENHYVPIVRWKRGEQSALFELDSKIKDLMSPLIEIPPIDWDFENECAKKTIDEHLKNFALQLKTNWNHPNSIFIDAVQICLDDDEVMSNGDHPLEYIFDILSNENISAIPVISKERGYNYQNAVKKINSIYKTGFAIRLHNDDFDDINSTLSSIFIQFPSKLNEIDLILDYKYIDPKDPIGRMTNFISGSLLSLPNIKKWRTLTLAATSFPENLSEFPSGEDGAIPRVEWLIYQQLLKSNLPRIPTFGDYIISNPEYSRIDPRFIKMSANIRYTTDNEYLIFRGYSVTNPKYGKWAQSHGLCQRVVAHSKYSGQHYSYGDNYIFDCANGTASTGNAETWRKIGTNHHLTFVVNELSSFHASLVVGSP